MSERKTLERFLRESRLRHWRLSSPRHAKARRRSGSFRSKAWRRPLHLVAWLCFTTTTTLSASQSMAGEEPLCESTKSGCEQMHALSCTGGPLSRILKSEQSEEEHSESRFGALRSWLQHSFGERSTSKKKSGESNRSAALVFKSSGSGPLTIRRNRSFQFSTNRWKD